MEIIDTIQKKIYQVREETVMLDRDLATLYGVSVKVLNQAVKRNLIKFPSDFMFQLTKEEELEILRIEIQTVRMDIDLPEPLRSQFVTLEKIQTEGRGKHRKYLPNVFTEYGIGMLSSVLKSDTAALMNITIMRAFGAIKKILRKQADITEKLKAIQQKLTEHDVQLSGIYDAIENILDENAAQHRWENRERIGFKKNPKK